MTGQPDLLEIVTSDWRGEYNRTVLSSTHVYTVVEEEGGDNYSEKTADELKEGEKVLWDVDSVDAKLAYLKDPLFAQVKSQLFVDVGGKTIPKFQYELLRACAEGIRINKETLDERLREGSIPSLSDVAALHIAKKYSANPDRKQFLPVNATLRRWVGGNSIAPQQLFDLRDLGYVLESEHLLEMYGDGDSFSTDVNTFWGAKKFYNSTQGKIKKLNLSPENVLEVKPLEGKIGDENAGTYFEETVEADSRTMVNKTPNLFNYLKEGLKKTAGAAAYVRDYVVTRPESSYRETTENRQDRNL